LTQKKRKRKNKKRKKIVVVVHENHSEHIKVIALPPPFDPVVFLVILPHKIKIA
jgi:hypothetical protein